MYLTVGKLFQETIYPNDRLLGRFFTDAYGPLYSRKTNSVCHGPTDQARLVRKSRKVCVDPYKMSGIFRTGMEYAQQHQKPHALQNNQKPYSARRDPTKELVDVANSKSLIRQHQFRLLRSTIRTSSLQNAPDRSEQTPRGKPQQTSRAAHIRERRSLLVEKEHSAEIANSSPRSYHIRKHGRSRIGLGSYGQRIQVKWSLEPNATQMAQQPEGAMGANRSAEHNGSQTRKSNSDGTNRQQNRSSLYNKRGRYEVFKTPPNDIQDLPPRRFIQNTSDCPVSPWSIQPDCRQLIQRKRIARMDPDGRDLESDLSAIWSSFNRPLCKRKIGGCEELCQRERARQELRVCGCVQSNVELRTRLDIPTTCSSTSRPTTLTEEHRSIPTSSTQMGEDLLEGRPEATSFVSTSNNLAHPQTPSGSRNQQTPCGSEQTVFAGLEGSGWSSLINSWPDENKKLLESSWRKSTLKTYKPAWERWRKWSETQNNCNTENPGPNDLAKFICHLHMKIELAPSTIAVHKSVVTTFANPMKATELNRHPLVRQTLKAVALSKPPPQKSLTWEVGELIEYLQHYSVNVDSLFQVSRHVAVLLLLATGRRVHDLTLLDISAVSFKRVDDSLIFWPKFGSKTDCATYRQSGWQLSPNEVHKLNLVFWIETLITVSELRRSSQNNLTSLFITTRGKVGPASRTVIAGWIRTIFKDAHIQDSPGSLRSAVNSANWKNNNMNLDEILKRGNWKSKDTFLRHYFKETANRQENNQSTVNIADSFSPL